MNFDGFCEIAANFLEEEDSEAMQEELKEAFRLYDREGKSSMNNIGLLGSHLVHEIKTDSLLPPRQEKQLASRK